MVSELEEYGVDVSIYDPLINLQKATEEFNISFVNKIEENHYDAIILAVAHDAFKELSVESIRRYGKQQHILYDVKHCLPADTVDGRL